MKQPSFLNMCHVLAASLAIAKLTDKLKIPWIVVLLPILIPYSFIISILIFVVGLNMFASWTTALLIAVIFSLVSSIVIYKLIKKALVKKTYNDDVIDITLLE